METTISVDPQTYAKYKQLREEYLNCAGKRTKDRLDLISTSYYAFTVNHQELKRALDAYQEPSTFVELWKIENRARLSHYLDEIARLLHNFVASAKSLIDHTRIIIRELHGNDAFMDEYEKRISTSFKESPLCRFVQDLRNYILHKGMPAVIAAGRHQAPDIHHNTIDLDRDHLLEWDGWTSRSKAFLKSSDSRIELQKVGDLYREDVVRLYQWLEGRQQQLHKKDFEEMEQLFNEAKGLEGIDT